MNPAMPKISDPRHNGTTGLLTNPGGVMYNFIWDWQADIGQPTVNDATVWGQARDPFRSGQAASSVPFNLSTPASSPSLQITITSPTGGTVMNSPVLIEYELIDAASNTVDVEMKYSVDNGATFRTARPHCNTFGAFHFI